jgi:hypothetical protein
MSNCKLFVAFLPAVRVENPYAVGQKSSLRGLRKVSYFCYSILSQIIPFILTSSTIAPVLKKFVFSQTKKWRLYWVKVEC